MSHFRPFSGRIVASLALLVSVVAAVGAEARENDRAPELISVEGPRWKNVRELRRFAELGDAQAQFELGQRLVNGDGVTRDGIEAAQWLEKAAQAGVADAAFRLGKLYHDGGGVTRDYARSFEYYTMAARAGLPEAHHNLGAMLVSARGVKRDYVEGLAWLIVATKSGAMSTAEQDTRERLAKRPELITQAEARAKELLEQLERAPESVQPKAIFPGAAALTAPALAKPSVEQPPKKVEISPAPKLEAPKPQLSPTLTLPAPKLEAPKPEPGVKN